MDNQNFISCPKCGHEFQVEQVLAQKLDEKYKKELNDKVSKLQDDYKQKESLLKEKESELIKQQEESEKLLNEKVKIESEKLKKELSIKLKEEYDLQIKELNEENENRKKQILELSKTKIENEKLKRDLEAQKTTLEAQFEEQLSEKIKEATEKEKQKITEYLSNKMKEEYEVQLKALQDESSENKKKIQELNQTKIENEKLKRMIDEQKETLEVEFEQKMTQKLKEETDTIRKRETEKIELKIREKDEVINSMKSQIEEMKRRAEQGSMQLQGEVQELALEEILKNLFVTDLIEDVGKGVKGADVIHTVRNKFGNDCGKIIYESKRTKHFSHDWIEKLKNDAVSAKADISIIVTEALPDGIDKIGQTDGVWICTFFDIKGFAIILRDSLVRIFEVQTSQTNKGEKMQMLYDYLMSNEFKMQLGAIVDGFSSLQDSYVKEKRAMERIWKEREKQLEKVLLNTNHFIGSIQGIAGSSIPNLKQIGDDNKMLEE